MEPKGPLYFHKIHPHPTGHYPEPQIATQYTHTLLDTTLSHK